MVAEYACLDIVVDVCDLTQKCFERIAEMRSVSG